ncbi:unnamed protein product [Dracunculus medinensis]|uniref:WASH_WAHD domain-containing protein n=1 Tax=Dracunculus medinensis TaxID=318479 RepID=A0A0N4UNK0_DRAME|nr:unnamed protein product [Dracunculus medinensis]
MNVGHLAVSLVQRQLREDWDNREYAQVISDNIKHIADFLGNFELSCRSKIAALNDKITVLERKIEFLEAQVDSFHIFPFCSLKSLLILGYSCISFRDFMCNLFMELKTTILLFFYLFYIIVNEAFIF